MIEERLYMQDIQKELQYRDRRSVHRWCQNNNVRILCDVGTNKQFVLGEEFEKGKSKNYFNHAGVMKASRRFFSNKLTNKVKTMMDYKPQGEYEKEVLSIFTNL